MIDREKRLLNQSRIFEKLEINQNFSKYLLYWFFKNIPNHSVWSEKISVSNGEWTCRRAMHIFNFLADNPQWIGKPYYFWTSSKFEIVKLTAVSSQIWRSIATKSWSPQSKKLLILNLWIQHILPSMKPIFANVTLYHKTRLIVRLSAQTIHGFLRHIANRPSEIN